VSIPLAGAYKVTLHVLTAANQFQQLDQYSWAQQPVRH